jgi:capsular exopolysaccharide synthesis family protein
MRRPRLQKAFGLENTEGISTAVTSNREPSEFVQETQIDGLDIITSGEVPPNPSELIHSSRFEEVIDELDAQYDRLIFDSPPLAAVSDSLILSQVAEGVLLVLESNKTRREVLRKSIEQLEGVGAPLLGFVFNKVSVDDRSYYGYSYYGDYSYYGEDADDQEVTNLAG